MRATVPSVVLLVALGLAGRAQADILSIDVDPGLKHLHISACFAGNPPRRLTAASPAAIELLTDVRSDAGEALTPAGKSLGFPAGSACLHYRVRLDKASQDGHWRREFIRHHGAILLSPGLILWLPEDGRRVDIQFKLPKGMTVSTPWAPLSRDEYRFAGSDRPDDWGAKIAIGRMSRHDLSIGAARLEVAILEGRPAADEGEILTWLRRNAEAVAAVNGRLPVRRTQVLVVPIGRGDEPVPWGQLSRGGGESVQLYIDQRIKLAGFLSDWVLSHELAHLFHPFIDVDGRWIYEGMASYYQNVARARAGLMSEKAAWEELHAGFKRGRFQTRRNQTLREASARMMRTRAFMRVYWSGAAIFLLADLELRERSQGRQSLDSVLGEFSRCCLPSNRLWSPQEFLAKLDELSGLPVFDELYQTHALSDRFPDTGEAFRRLGLSAAGSNALHLSNDPEAGALRRAIMGRRP